MSETNAQSIRISDGSSMKDLFPGYYPLDMNERAKIYQQGLISLDANALLDLYRFNKGARHEFFAVLERLRPRLFVTHQAALEFHRNRLSTVESRLNAAEEKCKEIELPLKSVVEKIQEFANRYQIDPAERGRLIGLVEDLSSTLTDSIKAAGAYDLTRDQVKDGADDVLKRLNLLLAGRIGKAPSDAERKTSIAEALRRREEKIPPGYAEKKLSPELQAGDYLVWHQLINEASKHKRSVLLVTNENKEDWVLKGSSNQILGPRPELVLEMQAKAKVPFLMVTVVGLLKEAPSHLGATVSDSTIREAESIPQERNVNAILSASAQQQYESMSEADQNEFVTALSPVYKNMQGGKEIEALTGPDLSRLNDCRYSLRWPSGGKAIFSITDEPSGDFDAILEVYEITQKG